MRHLDGLCTSLSYTNVNELCHHWFRQWLVDNDIFCLIGGFVSARPWWANFIKKNTKKHQNTMWIISRELIWEYGVKSMAFLLRCQCVKDVICNWMPFCRGHWVGTYLHNSENNALYVVMVVPRFNHYWTLWRWWPTIKVGCDDYEHLVFSFFVLFCFPFFPFFKWFAQTEHFRKSWLNYKTVSDPSMTEKLKEKDQLDKPCFAGILK